MLKIQVGRYYYWSQHSTLLHITFHSINNNTHKQQQHIDYDISAAAYL